MNIELRLRKSLSIVSETSTYITKLASLFGVSEKTQNLVCFIVESVLELRMNSLQNGDELIVDLNTDGKHFNIKVTDKGLPYVLTENQKLILKKGYVESFSASSLGNNGQCLEFSFKIENQICENIGEDVEEQLLDKNFTFRLTENNEEDILKVIRCIYSQYKFNYTDTFYNVQTYKDMLEDGSYISILGENEHKQVVVHGGLAELETFPKLAEFGNLVTKPFARGCGLASKLFSYAEEIGMERKFNGIFGETVTSHPISQKLFNKLNYTPCGAYFDNLSPEFVGSYGDGKTRYACMYTVKLFDKKKVHNIYAPEKLSEFIGKIFEQEQVAYNIDSSDYEITKEKTEYMYTYDSTDKLYKVFIKQPGKDYQEAMEQLVQKEEFEWAANCTFFVNASVKGALTIYRKLIEEGFIFTGILPGVEYGDLLILQKFKSEPNTTTIVLELGFDQIVKDVLALKEELSKLHS